MRIRELYEWGRIVKGVNTTVDVGPNEIKTQAAKFGNTVDKDGKPPTLSTKVKGKSTNVLYNLGLAESKQQTCPRTKASSCQCESVNKVTEAEQTLTAVCVLGHSDKVKGTILLKQEPGNPTLIVGEITGLAPGKHGFHIHEFGDLSKGCESAGGHYNPDGVDHGDIEKGHVGDLGNIEADDEGVANIKIIAKRIDLAGDRSVVGRSIVIHSDEDDLGKGGDDESLKTGNAGDRLACGVITLKETVTDGEVNTTENTDDDHIPYQDIVAKAIRDKKMTFINPNTGKEQSVMNPAHVGNRQKELAFKYIYDYPMTPEEKMELRPWVNIPGDKNLMKMPVTQMTADQAVKWGMLGHPDIPQATIDAAKKKYPDDSRVKNITSESLKEKWSAKYKRSINCSNPKGFSQKAHCAGRNKESIEEGEFRANDVEEFKPSNDALNDLKSKYLPDWEMLDHRILQAKYVADDHRAAEAFVRIINRLSEKMDHFCEVTQDVAEVTVRTTTFDVKGLTILDFQIAMVIDKFADDVKIKQVPMSGNFGMHEDIMLDEGIIDSILDFLKPYIDKAKNKLAKLREAIKREWWETGLMWEIIQKGTKAKDHEIEFANNQFKDMLKAVGLGSWLALPIPGNTLWITLLEKLLNKFDVSIMPDSVKQVGVFDSMYENFADGKVKGKSRPGRVKRAGASCKGSVTKLRKQAKNASGERAKMYHWCANMKSGRKK